MKKRLYFIISVILTSLGGQAVTLNSIMDSIAVNNTELKSKAAEYKSKIAGIKSTNNLGDTDIDFEYQKGDNINGNKHGFSISQGFDWPGMYIARSQANKSLTNAAEYEYRAQKLNILLNAKQICLNIINFNRKIKAQTEIHNNIKQLYTEYEKGFKHGEISILDINKLKIELLNVKQTLDSYITQRQALIEDITGINGDKVIYGIELIATYPEQELQAIDTYLNQLTSIDPEHNYNNEMIINSGKEVTMAKMGWMPKFSIGYKYANELGDKFNGFSVGMSLPIFSNRNKVSEAQAAKTAFIYSGKNEYSSKCANIKKEYSQIVYLKEQIYAYGSVLTDNANTEILKKALNGGQISLLDYLMELRYFLEAQQTLLDLEYEYNSTLTSLNKYQLL